MENLRHDLTVFQAKYALNLKDLRNRMSDANFSLEALEHCIENKASKFEGKFKLIITAQMESIKPIIANHLVEAESKIKSMSLLGYL